MTDPIGTGPLRQQLGRRSFMMAAAGGLLGAPLAAEAQEPGKVLRIGVLGANPPGASNSFPAFRKALQELGYVEGQNVRLEYRWPESGREGYPALAAQLVQSRVDVILTISSASALAAKRATDTLPIVFCALGDDPVRLGLVASLARPGRKPTGTVSRSHELAANRLELLKEALPGLSRAAAMWKANNPAHPRTLQNLQEAGRHLSVRVIPVEW